MALMSYSGPVCVGNPVRQEGTTHKKIDILDDIRTRKNKHYRTSIKDQLPNTELHITGFSMYGLTCPEVLHKITVVLLIMCIANLQRPLTQISWLAGIGKT